MSWIWIFNENFLTGRKLWIPVVSEFIENGLWRLSEIGVDNDNLRTALALLVQYPVAWGLLLLAGTQLRTAKHLYSICWTTLLYGTLFDLNGVAHFYTCFLLCYVLLRLLSPKNAAIAIFVYTMLHLSYVQLARQFRSFGVKTFDHTAPFMVLVMKLTQLAWNVYDGSRPEADLNKLARVRRLQKVPDLAAYLGYLMFSPGFLIGPCFDFSEYIAFVNNEAPFDHRPSSVLPALKTLAKALAFMIIFAAAGPRHSYSFVGTDEYQLTYSFVQKVVFFSIAAAAARSKFYGAFKLSEGACVLSGLGWNGYLSTPALVKPARSHSGDLNDLEPQSAYPEADASSTGLAPQWNRVAQVNVRKLETACSFREIISNWNIQTANWLKYYVYFRVSQPGDKSSGFAVCITYLVSAIWHGFYPGYYLTFVTGALCTICGNKLRRALRPWAYPQDETKASRTKQRVYNVAGWILTQIALCYAVAPFLVLTMPLSIAAWGSVYYYIHFAIALLLICDFVGLFGLVRSIIGQGGRLYQFKEKTTLTSRIPEHLKTN